MKQYSIDESDDINIYHLKPEATTWVKQQRTRVIQLTDTSQSGKESLIQKKAIEEKG